MRRAVAGDGVQVAVAESLGGEHPADDDDRGAPHAGREDLGAMSARVPRRMTSRSWLAWGLTVSPRRVGPDYIDPGDHALAAGQAGRNLDPWLVGEDQIAPMFAHGASTPELAGIAVIAIAGGPAFTFGYAEHAELLAAAGAEVVRFDPLYDEELPADVDGLVIGGGFPEEHAADLSANTRLRTGVAALADAGAPVIAECAGLLYLAQSLDGHPMCGVLDTTAMMTGRLTLGYRDAVAATASPLAPAGSRVHGHEFHRTTVQSPATAAAWHWKQGGTTVTEGYVQGQVHASYLHTHWNGIPGAADRITAAARAYRTARRTGGLPGDRY